MIGANSFVCSASLIKPGIVVTAAHCVANYGQSQFYSGWTFVPAYNNGSAPYGTWTAASATILTKYYIGTDSCAQFGVICPDDVALLTLNPQSGSYAGNAAGWFGYGWDGYGFNASSQALITQLGYPVALDGGLLMERNDSQGFVAPSLSNNTIIGSLMTGGSSGGPWLVNPMEKEVALGAREICALWRRSGAVEAKDPRRPDRHRTKHEHHRKACADGDGQSNMSPAGPSPPVS